VLLRVDIAMPALEIALGEDVEEYVGGVSRKSDGLG